MQPNTIQRYPRQSLRLAMEKQAIGFKDIYRLGRGAKNIVSNYGGSTGRNLLRTGGNIADYGKKLVKNPIKTLKDNALTAGATVRDKEKQFDILENALEGAVRDGKKINFSVFDDVAPDANIFKRGVQKLRGEGIATAGRSTKGNIGEEAQKKLIERMDSKGLLHRSKDGKTISIHRDADVDELRKVYDEVQKMDITSGPGMFDKARNTLNYVPLPGERGMLGLGIAGSALPQLANKETKDGRQRGLAERIGRAGLMTAAELAVAPIGIANRLYGTGLGTATEIGGTLGTELLLNKNNKSNAANALSNQRMGQAAMQQPKAPRGSRTRRHQAQVNLLNPMQQPKPVQQPMVMQKQANSHTAFARATDAYDYGVSLLGGNAGTAVHAMLQPIDVAKQIVEAVRDKDKRMLLLAPGLVAGYTGLGYGAYKGGQKVKEKLKKRHEEKEKTASIPKNPRARLRRLTK